MLDSLHDTNLDDADLNEEGLDDEGPNADGENADGEVAGTEHAHNSDDAPACVSGHALVVEDDMIIAMDVEDMLLEMGADRVTVAASVAHALEVVEGGPVGFALLDVNLGEATSAPVARALRERGVPFAFATGYADLSDVSREMPEVPVLRKPYAASTLQTTVRALAAR